jgi:aldehyde dehydrogenase (NAD+)
MGAIAAGCPSVLKPSELSPATSSLLADLFPKYLDHSAYRVVNGYVPEVTYLLKLKWDHSAYDQANHGVDRMLIVGAGLSAISHVHRKWGRSPYHCKGRG